MMKDRAQDDGDFSKPFTVEWLKVVHMPFRVFDTDGLQWNGSDLSRRASAQAGRSGRRL